MRHTQHPGAPHWHESPGGGDCLTEVVHEAEIELSAGMALFGVSSEALKGYRVVVPLVCFCGFLESLCCYRMCVDHH